LNGFTNVNWAFKSRILEATGADLICVSETHLKETDEPTLGGHKWFGQNRQSIHKNKEYL
jgi:hypothetical protein